MDPTKSSGADYAHTLQNAHLIRVLAQNLAADGALDDAIAQADHADSVGAILDPTSYRSSHQKLREDRETLAAVRIAGAPRDSRAMSSARSAGRRWRKKPVVVEAIRIDAYTQLCPIPGADLNDDWYEPFLWLNRNAAGMWRLCSEPGGRAYVEIDTLEGTMRADVGDWVIRGVQGEVYPCKHDIFAETYEEADDVR